MVENKSPESDRKDLNNSDLYKMILTLDSKEKKRKHKQNMLIKYTKKDSFNPIL